METWFSRRAPGKYDWGGDCPFVCSTFVQVDEELADRSDGYDGADV